MGRGGAIARRGLMVAVVFLMTMAGRASAQDSSSAVRADPVQFFAGLTGQSWIGNGRYFVANYSDTLHITVDSTGRGLVIERVLVNKDRGVAISRGRGTLTPEAGDSTFVLLWSERRYPHIVGHLRWSDSQWKIALDGEWSAWSIHVRTDATETFVAAVARSLGGLPPMELVAMTYHVAGSAALKSSRSVPGD